MVKVAQRFNLSSVLSVYLLFFYLVVSILYFYFFALDNSLNYEPILGFRYPVNIHDHFVYIRYIEKFESGDIALSINNNIGISYFYYILGKTFYYVGITPNFYYISLALNLLVLFVCFIVYKKILLLYGHSSAASISFFFMSFLVYFAQLINKDSLTILITLLAVLFVLKNNYKMLMLLMVLSIFVRFQLSAVLFFFLILRTFNKRPLLSLFVIYSFLSFVNGYLAKYQTLFLGVETIGDGLSALVYRLNVNYYIGSFLFNPVRALQYFYDYYLSLQFYGNGFIDVSRLKNLPHLFFFTFLIPFIFRVLTRYSSVMKSREGIVLSLVVSFFLIWLFNPTVNSRYLICFLPIIQILALNEIRSLRKSVQRFS